MFKITKSSFSWNNQKIELETGKIARQANSSVVIRMGSTTILCTITCSKEKRDGVDFLPLSVHLIEKFYASGRFPGGFMKREGKPSEREVLISRVIDRAIRPLFPKNFFYEVNIVCQVLSYDSNTPIDVLSIIAAAAAIQSSDIPFEHPFAAVKVGVVDDRILFNPTASELEKSDIDLTLSATRSSIIMIESSVRETNCEQISSILEEAYQNLQVAIDAIEQFSSLIKREKYDYASDNITPVYNFLKQKLYEELKIVFKISDDSSRKKQLDLIYQEVLSKHCQEINAVIPEVSESVVIVAYKELQREVFREQIVEGSVRIDGRKYNEIRAIDCEVNLLPQTHGSSLFTRGGTQSLTTVTLGSSQDAQMRDDITGVTNEALMLHYNFPPYSVGEVGMLRPPGRREIGHGKLAMKAIKPVIPSSNLFPYTIRIVSEITESNGSSSMATVCAATLALMDAGIPIARAVSGIAMGVILNSDGSHVVLSDITGLEDSLGDMDFKISMTEKGVTALQMDVKTTGVTMPIIKNIIAQAKDGCIHIRHKITEEIPHHRDELNVLAPRVTKIKIDVTKIKDVIGPGGKNIRELCERTESKIDIDDSGDITVFSLNKDLAQQAVEEIREITASPEIGKIYKAKVVKLVTFGLFAKFSGNNEGLVHISELPNKSTYKVGDDIKVKYISTDHRGKIKLSININ